MATFLDIAGQEHVSTVMVFLFVVVGMFALLQAQKLFSAPPWMHILLAVAIGFFVILSPTALRISANLAPWFAVIFLLMLLITIAGKMLGGGPALDENINKSLFSVFIFIVIVFIVGTGIREGVSIPGDNETSTDFERDYTQTSHVIFHPKVLGFILIFGIAIAAVSLMVTAKP